MIRYLIDTNVLVYPHDTRDALKRTRARAVLDHLMKNDSGALSAQVLAEFSNVTLHKLKHLPADVYAQVEDYEVAFPVYPLTPAVVLEAVRGMRDYRLSYYDAQIWAVAKLNQIPIVLSEDFNTGGGLEGVTFLDPLEPAFDPAGL